MAGSSREFFEDTILEFMCETSEANEDNIDTLFEALLLGRVEPIMLIFPPIILFRNSFHSCPLFHLFFPIILMPAY